MLQKDTGAMFEIQDDEDEVDADINGATNPSLPILREREMLAVETLETNDSVQGGVEDISLQTIHFLPVQTALQPTKPRRVHM